ncbi:hypothetical protein ACU8KH_03402 [Lachancea thermotolerans]
MGLDCGFDSSYTASHCVSAACEGTSFWAVGLSAFWCFEVTAGTTLTNSRERLLCKFQNWYFIPLGTIAGFNFL